MPEINKAGLYCCSSTQTPKYKSDERQLKSDRARFESLFTKAKAGHTDAIKELSEIRPQDTVLVFNNNDRLLNQNTAFLLRAQNEIRPLSEEQSEQSNLILAELRQNPENDDITEADVQNYILQEQII